ncbi:hypothetical protein [Amycolatopsis tucumanensis]|nr:hypothetical protein [Amycolatopsis tucumanensis]MCF6423713.1 hypothetical protein [Amycolatopsis tucumanensis]
MTVFSAPLKAAAGAEAPHRRDRLTSRSLKPSRTSPRGERRSLGRRFEFDNITKAATGSAFPKTSGMWTEFTDHEFGTLETFPRADSIS